MTKRNHSLNLSFLLQKIRLHKFCIKRINFYLFIGLLLNIIITNCKFMLMFKCSNTSKFEKLIFNKNLTQRSFAETKKSKRL